MQASQGPTCAVLQAPHNTALGAYEAPNQLAGDLKFHQGCSVALPIPQLQQPGSRAERQRLWPQPAAGRWTANCTHCSQSGGLRCTGLQSGKAAHLRAGSQLAQRRALGVALQRPQVPQPVSRAELQGTWAPQAARGGAALKPQP